VKRLPIHLPGLCISSWKVAPLSTFYTTSLNLWKNVNLFKLILALNNISASFGQKRRFSVDLDSKPILFKLTLALNNVRQKGGLGWQFLTQPLFFRKRAVKLTILNLGCLLSHFDPQNGGCVICSATGSCVHAIATILRSELE
jgi:hypothetical protein